jgi:uncharacterized protein (TIGR03437 family)
MRPVVIPLSLFCLACLAPRASAVTATYTNSSQNVTLTGLGGSGGVGQSQVEWGTCAYDGTNTNCTVSAPYTGVGGGGTISIVFSYPGNGASPFTANSISPGSNQITFGLLPGNSGKIVVSLQESTGANVTFLSNDFVFYFYSSATCTGIAASSCSVGQVGLTPNATITGPVYGSFDATPVILAVISASDFGAFPAAAPGSWMEIYGTNLANVTSQIWTAADFNGNAAPTALGGNTVTIGGQSTFIDYISPSQVNAQAPSNVATGPQAVVITTPGGTSAPFTLPVNATEPGMDAPPLFNLAGVQYAVALHADYSFVLPQGAVAGVNSRPAQPGEEIVLYGIGFGPVTPIILAGQLVQEANTITSSFAVSIGGQPVTNVAYSGLAPDYTGLYQFNVVVPPNAGSGTVPLTFTVDGVAGTQTLSLSLIN